MTNADNRLPRLHEDTPLFRQAVTFTAATTGFSPRLIEKDYFCAVILSHLAGNAGGLVFKGGTCLAKVFAGFYRLSEDLDFVIPLPFESSRKERSASLEPLKSELARLSAVFPAFEKPEPLVGANRSTQYLGTVRFNSPTSGQTEQISIEVSLREPLLTPIVNGSAKSILKNPVTDKPMVAEVMFPCISLKEALAEKVRAALSRREVAIRDFYDLLYAVKKLGLDFHDKVFLDLVRRKLAAPGNDSVDLSPQRFAKLQKQVETRLKSVLRPTDFENFDLEEAFRISKEINGFLNQKI